MITVSRNIFIQAPFEPRIGTRPEENGTRLTQTEQFEPTEDMLHQALPPTLTNAVMEKIYRLLPFLDPDYAARVRRGRENRLVEKLGEKLEHWLTAIKQHLESCGRRELISLLVFITPFAAFLNPRD